MNNTQIKLKPILYILALYGSYHLYCKLYYFINKVNKLSLGKGSQSYSVNTPILKRDVLFNKFKNSIITIKVKDINEPDRIRDEGTALIIKDKNCDNLIVLTNYHIGLLSIQHESMQDYVSNVILDGGIFANYSYDIPISDFFFSENPKVDKWYDTYKDMTKKHIRKLDVRIWKMKCPNFIKQEHITKLVSLEDIDLTYNEGGHLMLLSSDSYSLTDYIPYSCDNNSGYLYYSAGSKPGCSGSALLNSRGKIIGIHHTSLQSGIYESDIINIGSRLKEIIWECMLHDQQQTSNRIFSNVKQEEYNDVKYFVGKYTVDVKFFIHSLYKFFCGEIKF